MVDQNKSIGNIWSFFEESRELKKKPYFKPTIGNHSVEFSSEPRHWYDEKHKKHNIIVELIENGIEKVFFCEQSKFVIIKGIKEMGFPLIGRKAIIGRTGELGGTRYTFTEVPKDGE